MLVIADGAGGDAVVVEQLLGLPRIFAGDHIYFLQDSHSPQSDVLQIADGRAHQVERRSLIKVTAIAIPGRGVTRLSLIRSVHG